MQRPTINFWYAGSAGQDKYFNGASKHYKAENPDIRIKRIALPSPAKDIEARLNAGKLTNTALYIFFTVAFTMVISLSLAILLNRGLKGTPLFRTSSFIPFAGGNDWLGRGGIGWLNSYWGLIAPYVAGSLGFFYSGSST